MDHIYVNRDDANYVELKTVPFMNIDCDYDFDPWRTSVEFDVHRTVAKRWYDSTMYQLHIVPYFKIKEVIFNDPATIVYWEDGTKTVVKCGKDDTYNKETGLALCFMKKALNNKGNYNNLFREYIKEK